MEKLPKEFKQYFWDIDFAKLNPAKYPIFIQERLFEYGSPSALRWLLAHFNKEELSRTIRKTRKLPKKTVNYWTNYLNIPKKEVLCLSKPFQEKHNLVWQR